MLGAVIGVAMVVNLLVAGLAASACRSCWKRLGLTLRWPRARL